MVVLFAMRHFDAAATWQMRTDVQSFASFFLLEDLILFSFFKCMPPGEKAIVSFVFKRMCFFVFWWFFFLLIKSQQKELSDTFYPLLHSADLPDAHTHTCWIPFNGLLVLTRAHVTNTQKCPSPPTYPQCVCLSLSQPRQLPWSPEPNKEVFFFVCFCFLCLTPIGTCWPSNAPAVAVGFPNRSWRKLDGFPS